MTDLFGLDDTVHISTRLTWGHGELGNLSVGARWIKDGQEVLSSQGDMALNMDPFSVWFHVPAARLGVGKFRVDILVDGVVVGSHGFEVR